MRPSLQKLYSSFILVVIAIHGPDLAAKTDRKPKEASNVIANWDSETKADKIRLKSISSIQAVLSKPIAEDKQFELYLRLGELLTERSEFLRAVEIMSFNREFDQWKATKAGPEPVISHEASKAELLKASGAFHKLVRMFPQHARSDAALFALARSLDQLDNPQALDFYLKMVHDYPNSTLMHETYLALGEYYFNRGKIPEATRAYQEAIRYKDAKSYLYAVYKLGWAYYNSDYANENQQNEAYQRALTAFKLVVRLSDRNKAWNGIDLRREAINDLVMVWAEIEGVEDAFAYFSKVGEYEAFYDVLEKLGNAYADQGKNIKAISAYERLIKEAPHRERTPEIYIKLAGLHDLVGSVAHLISDFERSYPLVFGDSPWTRAHKSNPKLIAEAKDALRAQIHRYGALLHQRGQKSTNDDALKGAIRLYQMFLAKFPQEPDAYQIRYYLADIYFYFKMYEPASDEYLRVASQSAAGKYHREAALNAVVAMNNLVTGIKWPELPPLGEVPKPLTIPREKSKLIKVIDAFVGFLPRDPEGFPMRIAAAKIFFEYGRYEDALARFENIALTLPETKEGKVSLETILNFHTKNKHWIAIITKSRKYLATRALSVDPHSSTITTHLKNAIYKLAFEYGERKQHVKAAETFLAFQKEFPNDPDSDKALFNASANYYKIDLVDNGLETDRLLLTSYPQSKLVPDVNLRIATTYEGIANFKDAANFYALFAATYPSDARAPVALYNAAMLYKGLKEYEQSNRHFEAFINAYNGHGNVPDALFEMAANFEKLRLYPQAVNSYRSYLARAQGIEADRQLFVQAKTAMILFKYVDPARGLTELQQLGGFLQTYRASAASEARRLVADTFFHATDEGYGTFKRSKIASAQSLESDVQAKQQVLLGLAKQFEGVMAIGSGEYVVASLFRLGELHENFADDLFNAPDPIAADQVTIDQYRSSIEKVAFPLKEEAFKYYETAYKRSGEVETFTEWTKKAYEKMASLFPERHPEVMEMALDPKYLSHNLPMSSDVDGLIE